MEAGTITAGVVVNFENASLDVNVRHTSRAGDTEDWVLRDVALSRFLALAEAAGSARAGGVVSAASAALIAAASRADDRHGGAATGADALQAQCAAADALLKALVEQARQEQEQTQTRGHGGGAAVGVEGAGAADDEDDGGASSPVIARGSAVAELMHFVGIDLASGRRALTLDDFMSGRVHPPAQTLAELAAREVFSDEESDGSLSACDDSTVLDDAFDADDSFGGATFVEMSVDDGVDAACRHDADGIRDAEGDAAQRRDDGVDAGDDGDAEDDGSDADSDNGVGWSSAAERTAKQRAAAEDVVVAPDAAGGAATAAAAAKVAAAAAAVSPSSATGGVGKPAHRRTTSTDSAASADSMGSWVMLDDDDDVGASAGAAGAVQGGGSGGAGSGGATAVTATQPPA